jgi:putative membrane protein
MPVFLDPTSTNGVSLGGAKKEVSMRFLLRLLINAAALWVAVQIVPGITYSGDWAPFFGVALVFGLVNAFIRPLVKLLTLPIIFLTLGLFALVVNGMMLWLTGYLSSGLGMHFQVDGCWTAVLGALVVSIVSALLSTFLVDAE